METYSKSPYSRSSYNSLRVLANTVAIIISGSSTEIPHANLCSSEKGIEVCWSVCILHPLSAHIPGELSLSWLLDFDSTAQTVKDYFLDSGGPKCSPKLAGLGNLQAKKPEAAHL